MTLGERCDEIVRLIDETLSACELTVSGRLAPVSPVTAAAVRSASHGAVRTSHVHVEQGHSDLEVLARSA